MWYFLNLNGNTYYVIWLVEQLQNKVHSFEIQMWKYVFDKSYQVVFLSNDVNAFA